MTNTLFLTAVFTIAAALIGVIFWRALRGR